MGQGPIINRRLGAALGVALAMAGCETTQSLRPVSAPATRPATLPVATPKPGPVAKPTSKKSAALRSYLAQVQSAQLSQGLLRRDGGGADTPFTTHTLVRNFEKIAFYNEYDGNFSGKGGKSPLRRWVAPIHVGTVFGAGVPPSVRASDGAAIRRYATRLGQITRHPISNTGSPNFLVIVAGDDDRAAALAEAAARIPNFNIASLRVFQELPRDTYCAVIAFPDANNPYVYTTAVALIRAENPDLLRLSCIHEEMAQGLGLANDSPAARPSIFNDDDEFALLTRHDEHLLRMLYDKRLRPGMTAKEAEPIARTIAHELAGGPL